MTENLPVAKFSQELSAKPASTSTLLGRGLASIQNRQLLIANQDELYRKARDIYNRITHYGWEFLANEGENIPVSVSRTEEINNHLIEYKLPKSLSNIFDVFKDLVEQDYGKAYLPLASFYHIFQYQQDTDEEYKILETEMIQLQTRGLAWCLDKNDTNDHEILSDLAINYLMGYWSEMDRQYYGDVKKSFVWYRRLAEQGYPEAQYALSWIYKHRINDMQHDELAWLSRTDDQNLAIQWLCRAADQNYPIAQYKLAGCYEIGDDVKEDSHQSFYWYHKAALQGYLPAQTDLGFMYLNGRGVEQDNSSAKHWFQKAAMQGYVRAQEILAILGNT